METELQAYLSWWWLFIALVFTNHITILIHAQSEAMNISMPIVLINVLLVRLPDSVTFELLLCRLVHLLVGLLKSGKKVLA